MKESSYYVVGKQACIYCEAINLPVFRYFYYTVYTVTPVTFIKVASDAAGLCALCSKVLRAAALWQHSIFSHSMNSRNVTIDLPASLSRIKSLFIGRTAEICHFHSINLDVFRQCLNFSTKAIKYS